MSPGRSIKVVGQTLLLTAWWCGALFWGAGELTWKRGWICTVLYLGGMMASTQIIKRMNPGLLAQREKGIHEQTKSFDRVFVALFLPLAFVLPGVAGLDAVRFGWAPLPRWTVYPGVSFFAASTALILWVMLKNPHAETTVRIQAERGHTVIAAGPYGFVRHPMYVGLILLYLSQAMILGSGCALVLAAVIAALFGWRTTREDQTLRRELPGYEQYTSVTRYRLVPGIW